MSSNDESKISPETVGKVKTQLTLAGVFFVWFLVGLLVVTLVVILFVRGDPCRPDDLITLVEALVGWDVITGAVAVGFGAKFHKAIATRLKGADGTSDAGGSEKRE